jgi:hypothetical protein
MAIMNRLHGLNTERQEVMREFNLKEEKENGKLENG